MYVKRSLLSEGEETFNRDITLKVMSYFGIEDPTPFQTKEISSFMYGEYLVTHCCILYKLNERFLDLCSSLGIDIGDQEVMIATNGSIHYTPDYKLYPKLVCPAAE